MEKKDKNTAMKEEKKTEESVSSASKTAKGEKEVRKKEVEELKKRIEALEKEKSELNEKALRAHAEAENFKKRLSKEKEDFVKYSNEKVIKELLPVIDNLERAVNHAKEAGEGGALIEGVEMTLGLFHKTLDSWGVSRVASIGEPFNPEKHEAVQQIESAEHEPNIVISEFQKGYMLHERLVRPAMVAVSKAASEKSKEK